MLGRRRNRTGVFRSRTIVSLRVRLARSRRGCRGTKTVQISKAPGRACLQPTEWQKSAVQIPQIWLDLPPNSNRKRKGQERRMGLWFCQYMKYVLTLYVCSPTGTGRDHQVEVVLQPFMWSQDALQLFHDFRLHHSFSPAAIKT